MAWPVTLAAGAVVTTAHYNSVVTALNTAQGTYNANGQTIANIGATTFTGVVTVNANITTTGLIGIGTTTPTTPLHINKLAGAISTSNNIYSVARFSDGGAGSNMGITFETGGTGTTAYRGFFIAKSSQDFSIARFDSASSAGAVIDVTVKSNGYVGIGTTVPTSPLQVMSLPTYASDSAAGATLTAGAFYKDSSGGLHVKL